MDATYLAFKKAYEEMMHREPVSTSFCYSEYTKSQMLELKNLIEQMIKWHEQELQELRRQNFEIDQCIAYNKEEK